MQVAMRVMSSQIGIVGGMFSWALRISLSMMLNLFEKLVGLRPIFWVILQTPFDQILGLVSDVFRKINSYFEQVSECIVHFPPFVQGSSCHTFVIDHSNSPDFSLLVVDIILIGLGSHVRRWPNIVFQLWLRKPLNSAIAKVDDLGLSVVDHYICWF